jgi:hypothetical protein
LRLAAAPDIFEHQLAGISVGRGELVSRLMGIVPKRTA